MRECVLARGGKGLGARGCCVCAVAGRVGPGGRWQGTAFALRRAARVLPRNRLRSRPCPLRPSLPPVSPTAGAHTQAHTRRSPEPGQGGLRSNKQQPWEHTAQPDQRGLWGPHVNWRGNAPHARRAPKRASRKQTKPCTSNTIESPPTRLELAPSKAPSIFMITGQHSTNTFLTLDRLRGAAAGVPPQTRRPTSPHATHTRSRLRASRTHLLWPLLSLTPNPCLGLSRA